jgi:hypothetical protein
MHKAFLLTAAAALAASGLGAAFAPATQAGEFDQAKIVERSKCTKGYKPCLPPASDYDCYGGSGNGPAYTGRVKVKGYDVYRLDADGDGIGCETVSFWGPVR